MGKKPSRIPRRDQAKVLFIANVGNDEICRRCSVAPGTLRAWITRGKWVAARSASEQRLAERLDTKIAHSVSIDAAQHYERVVKGSAKLIDNLMESEPKKMKDRLDQAETLRKLVGVARENLGLTSEDQRGPTQFNFSVGSSRPEKVVEEVPGPASDLPPAGRE